MTQSQTPPGWYPDPRAPAQQRYWDGTQWTDNAAPLAQPPIVVQAKKGHGCLYAILGAIGAVVLLVIIFAVAIGGAANKASDDNKKAHTQALTEVRITSCGKDALGEVDIKGTAHNTSSKRSNYLIELVIVNKSGTQLDSSTTAANNVDPGQTANWDAPTATQSVPGVTCKVADVTRLASTP